MCRKVIALPQIINYTSRIGCNHTHHCDQSAGRSSSSPLPGRVWRQCYTLSVSRGMQFYVIWMSSKWLTPVTDKALLSTDPGMPTSFIRHIVTLYVRPYCLARETVWLARGALWNVVSTNQIDRRNRMTYHMLLGIPLPSNKGWGLLFTWGASQNHTENIVL